MTNAINPSHYKSDTIECIDAMKACSTPEEFRGHLKLTVLKYLWREDKKGEGDQARVENLEKAAWYLDRLVKDLRSNEITSKAYDTSRIVDSSGLHFVPLRDLEFPPSKWPSKDDEEIPPHTINAADQGWIEWKGGERPVKGMVDVEVASGRIDRGNMADMYWWDHRGFPGDILRYRIVK